MIFARIIGRKGEAMTLWDLTKDEFVMEFLICSSGSHMYRLLVQHSYIEAIKDVTTDEIEEFYNKYIRSEIKVLIANHVYGNVETEYKYNPDMWLTAIAVLIQERTNDKKVEEILKWLDYPESTIFHICNRVVFRMCWKRYQIRKEWMKYIW